MDLNEWGSLATLGNRAHPLLVDDDVDRLRLIVELKLDRDERGHFGEQWRQRHDRDGQRRGRRHGCRVSPGERHGLGQQRNGHRVEHAGDARLRFD
ncbi:MAG TPA: hypothetical protein VKU87_09220, partial [Thermomicrobiaceae bacterium]|nr:hypothetical protein [Thermomicrobiaceae bacterium]